MEITRENRPEAAVLRIKGEVDMRTSPALREEMRLLTKEKPPRLVVSLELVPYIDSSGIATLIEGLKNVRHYGGHFLLVGVNEDIYPVFELAHLTDVFELHREVKLD